MGRRGGRVFGGTARAQFLMAALAVAGCAGSRPAPVTPGAPAATLVGGCGPAPHDLVPKYVLPFAVGESHRLTQGNCGDASHDGRFRYAFDFRMPPGTPVIAAREGIVSAVRGHMPDGTGRVGDENYVFIEHADGETSRYIHLRRAGVWVSRGARVARGDTIGLSGNSGRSAFPHLHFDVVGACGGGRCETLPVAFLNSGAPIPTELGVYRAGSFPAADDGNRDPSSGDPRAGPARSTVRPPARSSAPRSRGARPRAAAGNASRAPASDPARSQPPSSA